jgi:hypothetical protein
VIFVFVFELRAHELCLEMALNPDLPVRCLLSSWDYRHEPPAPSCGALSCPALGQEGVIGLCLDVY